jgi:4-amino-4-deoxy-L-arabinose transferase-like glycosyltransferase
VLWQNSRLGVLWDLSYILENSYRISLGDFPYRDFPFPYPPLTFLIQAAIIKLSGRVFWHHIVYCALTSGLATVLTWRILINLLRKETERPRLLAFILSLPMIILGIYSIYPHPFYDPDSTLAILFSVLLLVGLERKSVSSWRSLLAGATLVIPLFVKQNAGLAFLVSAGLAIPALAIIEALRRRSIRKYLLVLVGAILALGIAAFLVHFTVGLKEYWYWTIRFAALRRTPARQEMIEIYWDRNVGLWLAFIIFGLVAFWFNRTGNRALAVLSAVLIAAPFTWPTVYLFRDQDSSERAERLLTLWPVLLIFALIVALVTWRRRHGLPLILPFILIAAINGVFMSQQLWGSTYAIWPLFMILLGSTLAGLASMRSSLLDVAPVPKSGLTTRTWLLSVTALIVLSLLVSGTFYLRSHERLDYANLDEGPLTRSSLPALKGLSVRGDWLPDFEELIQYTEREIPKDEGILVLPGEDIFFYATGRRPLFPVLMYDRTVNPFSPEEILKLARERNIRWLIVKQDLQDEDEEPEKERDELTAALEQDFEQVESLKNYDIYRRMDPKNSSDSDDDEP